MSEVLELIEEVLLVRFGVKSEQARFLGKNEQWLVNIHGNWLKIDLTGEGFGNLLVITVILGYVPKSHVTEFQSLLLEKNLELPGPSLWIKDSIFGLREVRYTDGLQDIELVDMLELMSEVARETKEELEEIYGASLALFGLLNHDEMVKAVDDIGGWY